MCAGIGEFGGWQACRQAASADAATGKKYLVGMRAVVLMERGGAPEVREWPEPTPAEGEVKVRILAAALNHRDVWITRGAYPGVAPPVVLGSDGVGEVDGARVLINPALHWGPREDTQGPDFEILGNPSDGTFADYVAVPAQNV